MKPTELRIGNYIAWGNDEVLRVDDIKSDVVGASGLYKLLEGFISYQDIHGVKLTEEWLIKFGFASNPLPDRYAELGPINCMTHSNKVSVTFEEGKWYPVRKYDGIQHIAYGIGLEYVHQLQNLYFALTGEELTIKS